MRKIIAIDPGWGGAIAFYIPDENKIGLVLCPDDHLGILDFLRSLQDKYPPERIRGDKDKGGDWVAYMENNHSSPVFGARGNFGLARNVGTWETALSCFGIQILYVEAKDWQRLTSSERSSVKKGREMLKEKAWRHARGCYPVYREKLGSLKPSPRSPRQGMADALCILKYARRKEWEER